MTLKLNNFPEKLIQFFTTQSFKVLEKFSADYFVRKDEEMLCSRIYNATSTLGYINYQQELAALECTQYFRTAAEACIYEFSAREIPTADHQTRNPWDLAHELPIIGCFGAVDDFERLASIEEIKYFHYPNEDSRRKTQFVADYVSAVKSYLSTNTVEASFISALVKAANEGKRIKEEQRFIVPVVKGLDALVSNNEAGWQAALQESLDAHLKEVKTGSYRQDYKGFICMPGMMLAKLGMEKGWKVDIDSLYLPLALLEA